MRVGTEITLQGPSLGRASLCEPILRALPEWFGIEEATRQYIRDVEAMPTFLATLDGQVVGFLTFRQHSDYAAEIHVMGVHPRAHRRGVGRALMEALEAHLQAQGIEYLQVKTLSPAHPDKNYAKTRAFYHALGFRPLEEFPDLWGEQNPCLQMIKYLSEKAQALVSERASSPRAGNTPEDGARSETGVLSEYSDRFHWLWRVVNFKGRGRL
jgi:ribosomal protein S18 acetylase RimI-like enzyme